MYTFRTATKTDLDCAWLIIQQAKAQMLHENKQQWDSFYPTLEHIISDIQNGYGYVLSSNGITIAYAAVVLDGEPTYDNINGQWLSDLPYVVIHRLAVADNMKHRGVASVFMDEVEKLSRSMDIRSFKVDTNFDNLAMQRILKKCGFTYCGEIHFQGDSRMAFEKLL